MTKANLFKDRKATDADPGAKGTLWTLGEGPVADALEQCNALALEIEAAKTKLKTAKEVVETYAGRRWVNHWASVGAQPAAPLAIATADGQSCLYIVQDRSRDFALSDKIITALTDEIGLEAVEVETRVSYAFDPDVLALEARDPLTHRKATIMAMIQRRIGPLLDDLVGSGQIERAHADGLVVAESKRVLAPDFVPALPELCERDAGKLGRVVYALGAAIVRFVKPA